MKTSENNLHPTIQTMPPVSCFWGAGSVVPGDQYAVQYILPLDSNCCDKMMPLLPHSFSRSLICEVWIHHTCTSRDLFDLSSCQGLNECLLQTHAWTSAMIVLTQRSLQSLELSAAWEKVPLNFLPQQSFPQLSAVLYICLPVSCSLGFGGPPTVPYICLPVSFWGQSCVNCRDVSPNHVMAVGVFCGFLT